VSIVFISVFIPLRGLRLTGLEGTPLSPAGKTFHLPEPLSSRFSIDRVGGLKNDMQPNEKSRNQIWTTTLAFAGFLALLMTLTCPSYLIGVSAEDSMDDDMEMRPFIRPIGMVGALIDDGFVPNVTKDPTFTTLDYPGALLTVANDINNSGKIVGFYRDANLEFHGFVYDPVSDSFASIDYTNPVCTTGTDARGINERGNIVGACTDNANNFYGYLLTADGFTAIQAPGHLSTIAQSISSDSRVVGCIHDTNTSTTMFAMSHDADGFSFFGGMFGGLNGIGFMHNGVSPDGTNVAGIFMDTSVNRARAYLVRDRVIMPFDYPGATLTQAWDVNAAGDVAGVYRDTSGRIHGYLRSANGEFTPVDYPGATLTRAFGINASGDIVGTYIAGGIQHAFVRSDKWKRHQ